MFKLVKDLRRQGFEVDRTGSGHWKVSRPGDGDRVILAFSPSGTAFHRSIKRLEQLGYQR